MINNIRATERAKYLRYRAKQLQQSFTQIKTDPMNLNLTLEHIAKMSECIDELLQSTAELYESNGSPSTES